MRVVAFTSGLNEPSSRFRVRQFIPSLASHGVHVDEYPCTPAKFDPVPFGVPRFVWDYRRLRSRKRAFHSASTADLVWMEREFLAGRETLELSVGRASNRILDIDDAIFLSGVKGFSERIAAGCAAVIVGNAWLAEHYRPHAKRVFVVPTSVEPADWAGGNPNPGQNRWIVGWTGSSANFPYLLQTEPALAIFLANHRDAVVRVVADKPPLWKSLPPEQIEFVRWTVEAERLAVRGMDVGLMPLADEEWARGKCAAKMLVYMAAGLPVVVSPVGANVDVLARDDVGYAARTTEEWLAALERLYRDAQGARAMGQRGLAVVKAEYSVTINAARLAAVFEEVIESSRCAGESI